MGLFPALRQNNASFFIISICRPDCNRLYAFFDKNRADRPACPPRAQRPVPPAAKPPAVLTTPVPRRYNQNENQNHPRNQPGKRKEKPTKNILDVYRFLKDAGVYYLATVEAGQPRVRPFGTVCLYQDRLYIQTGKAKAVSRQIAAEPRVELCACTGDRWLRVSATLREDDRVCARKAMLDDYPDLRRLYDENDGNTQVFYLTDAEATFSSFSAPPETVRF
ncbi:MAG: pyridoxamine 5'-phosphate oxidase family protein [Clostridia bacterium]|nr:pyridoxamine 5'-phosphate oxidase family protein [Clostridia bacterium]